MVRDPYDEENSTEVIQEEEDIEIPIPSCSLMDMGITIPEI